MKLKEYVTGLVNEMSSVRGISGELINFLREVESDPKYAEKAKLLREKIEQMVLKSGDKG